MRLLRFVLVLVVVIGAFVLWTTLRPQPSEPEQAGSPATQEAAPAPTSSAAKLDDLPRPVETPAEPESPQPSEPRAQAQVDAALGAIHGRVSFANDAPAVDVPIRLFGHSGGAAPVESRTDAEGRFEFVIAAGAWELAGRAPDGYESWREEIELAADDAHVADHVIADSKPLCVRVWCSSNGVVQPLAGARVTALLGEAERVERRGWRDGAAMEWAATDVDGAARVPVAAWSQHSLFIEADGFAPATLRVDFRPENSFSPTQPDGCIHAFLDRVGPSIRGRVLGEDGQPLSGAVVLASAPFVEERGMALDFGQLGERGEQLSQLIFATNTTPPVAFTGADGRFELTGPDTDAGPRRSFSLVVYPRRADYPQLFVKRLELTSLGRALDVDVRVKQGSEYELELVDEAGAPLEGLASVRDPDGRAYAPVGPLREHNLWDTGAGREFPLENGRLRIRHLGGVVLVGVTTKDGSANEESLITLPREGATEALRVVIPR